MMRNPRQEAFERLGGRYEVRVLEPSPPTVTEGPWFADDPAARGEVPGGRELVSPVSSGDLTWDELAEADPGLRAWAAERWLGAWRRLGPAPSRLVETRLALHRVAEDVMKPARETANGKFGLRFVHGGFGTPFFGDDVQLRVDGTDLVQVSPEGERREPLPGVDAAASRFVGDCFGFGASALEELRAGAAPELEPSRVQLWPEHFDIATELGAQAAGARAGYGASPGDEDHDEPYLYVTPWEASRAAGELWNATGFSGAELAFSDLLAADDQRATALDFYGTRLVALTG